MQDETVCLYENTPGEGEVWFFMLVEALVAAAEEQHRLAVCTCDTSIHSVVLLFPL